MARNTPTNSDDVIDSRDIIERLEELESERQDLVDAISDAQDEFNAAEDDAPEIRALLETMLIHAITALNDWDNDNADELKALQALAKEGEDYAEDWDHGATLVRESYFTDYCEELVSDIGDMPRKIPGYIVIDWEATADNLKADYTEIDFDGVTYLVR
jgi:uncharacterized protein (UPF0335 family)